MLQSIRDNITGWIAWIIIGLIAVVFIFWGVDFGSGTVNYAAKVDGERVSAQEVRRAWQMQQSRLQQMMRAELPEELVQSQQAAILDQFVRQSLLEQRAEEFGFHVTEMEVARGVMEIPQFQVDGKFSKDRYNAVIRSSGMSEAQFEADLRTEMLINQVQNGIVDSAFVASYELERRYAIEKQEREVNYALIAANDFLEQVSLTDEQIQKWYDDNSSQYLLPEKVDLQYVELTRARAESAVEVTEAALREYYEQVSERFTSPERRKARHILITEEEGLDDAAALKKAEELAAKAQGGADFSELAEANSKDPGSAQQGGDLGWAQRGMFVGPFEEALFSMTPGEIRGPVKTQFGYHVLKLDEVEEGDIRSFEDAQAELEAEYRAERSQAMFYDETEKLGDLAFQSLTELESVAAAMDLPLKTAEDFTREGGGELGTDPNIVEAVFTPEVLERGENSPLVTIGEDRVLVLRVTEHTPAEPRPLAEVRDQIEAQLRARAAREAAASKGADIVARLQKGETWDVVAEATEVDPVGTRAITREDAIAPQAVVRAAFEAPVASIAQGSPHFAGTVTDDGNYAVFSVSEVRDADPATEAAEAKQSRRQLAERRLGNEEFAAYVAEAERNAKIVKNPRVFE